MWNKKYTPKTERKMEEQKHLIEVWELVLAVTYMYPYTLSLRVRVCVCDGKYFRS